MSQPDTRSLEVPGARISYDVRGDLSQASPERPALLLFGSPMDATGFEALASHFQDRPTVTYDPRGSGRSLVLDGSAETTPVEHAEDLHLLVDALGVGPVDMFATSGGAVNALALAVRHPEQLRKLVAHEPPSARALPDCDAILAAMEDIHQIYMDQGRGPALAKFIALTAVEGPLPADYPERPAPDPAAFGLPTEDDGSRDDALLRRNIRNSVSFPPDLEALARVPVEIALAVGAESGDTLAARGAHAVSEGLGTAPVVLPGDHVGFVGEQFGMKGEPEQFAAKLRQVLAH